MKILGFPGYAFRANMLDSRELSLVKMHLIIPESIFIITAVFVVYQPES